GLLLAAPLNTPTTRRPAPVPEPKEPKWRQEFDKVYTLKDDELVKVIPRAERPDCRREFLRHWLVTEYEIKSEGLDKATENWERTQCFVFEIDSKGERGRTRHEGSLLQTTPNGPPKEVGTTIFGLTYSIARIEGYEIDADPRVNDVMFLDMPDVVVRSDAPR